MSLRAITGSALEHLEHLRNSNENLTVPDFYLFNHLLARVLEAWNTWNTNSRTYIERVAGVQAGNTPIFSPRARIG